MASLVLHSSSSAAHLVLSSCSQSVLLQIDILPGTNSLDIHQERSENSKHHLYKDNCFNHTLTSSGLYWVRANATPILMLLVTILGKVSKMSANVVTPFLVGGGRRSDIGAFGIKP